LVAGTAGGRNATGFSAQVSADIAVLVPTGSGAGAEEGAQSEAQKESGKEHRHRSTLAALGMLSRSSEPAIRDPAKAAIDALLATRDTGGTPLSHEALSVLYGLADGEHRAGELNKLLDDLLGSGTSIGVETFMDLHADLAVRPAVVRPPGSDDSALASALARVPIAVAAGLDSLDSTGDARDAVRWLGVLRAVRAYSANAAVHGAAQAEYKRGGGDGASLGRWVVGEALGMDAPASVSHLRDGLVGAWLGLWTDGTLQRARCGRGGRGEGCQPEIETDRHLLPIGRALDALACGSDLAQLRVNVEALEGAIGALRGAPATLLRHPHRLIDGARLVAVQDIARGVAVASATAELAKGVGTDLLARRLDAVVGEALRYLLELLGLLGDDAEDYREKAPPYYAVLYDVLEGLVEDCPASWLGLMRPGGDDEPPIVADAALQRGLFCLVRAHATDAKQITDFVDFCLEWLVDQHAGKGGHTRLGLTLRMLDMLSECGAGDDVWGRLAGRAASREVTRVLAGAYKAKNWAAVDGLRLSGGGEGSGSYEAAWSLAWRVTTISSAAGHEVRALDCMADKLRRESTGGDWEAGSAVWVAPFRELARCQELAAVGMRSAGMGVDAATTGIDRAEALGRLCVLVAEGGQTRVAVERHMRGPRRAELLEWLRWFSAVGEQRREQLASLLARVPSHRKPGWLSVTQWCAEPDAGEMEVAGDSADSRGSFGIGAAGALGQTSSAAGSAIAICRRAGWADLESMWCDVAAHPFVDANAGVEGSDGDAFQEGVEELPFEAAVAKLRELHGLAAQVEAATDALVEALGPDLGASWAQRWLGRDLEGTSQVIVRLDAPWAAVRRLVGDPSPATALQELMASAPEREAASARAPEHDAVASAAARPASPDLPGSDTWPRAIHARLAYEALIRGFAPVEAIRQIQFGGVKGAVATAVGWLYSTKVQLAGVAALAFAAIAGLLARTGPTGASPVDGLYPCNLPVPSWLCAALLLPLAVAILPALLLAVGSVIEGWRQRDAMPPLLAGRLAFPRLWAANLIGIAFLAMSDEGWTQMLSTKGYEFIGAAVFIVLAFLYIIFEVQRVSGSPRRRRGGGPLASAWPRALRLTLIGLNQCALLAVGIQVYSGTPILRRLIGDDGPGPEALAACFATPVGRIYPNALILWTVGAFFFGLLLQVLWEDRPLSEGMS
jgi:hypothetical protein